MKRDGILVLTHWSFQDALIQAYTLPYVFQIRQKISSSRKLILVTFEQEHMKMSESQKNERIEFLRKKGIELETFQYAKFNASLPFKTLNYFLKLTRLIKVNNIGIVHAWCTPAGSLGYLLSRFCKCKLIIDSYEPHAEAMVENGTWKKNSLRFKILFYLENKLSHYAKILISATSGMREYAQRKYNLSPKNFLVKPACVDLHEFNLSKRKNAALINSLELENKIVAVYAGKFGGIYLTFEVFQLLKVAKEKWGSKFKALLLTNHDKKEIDEWIQQAGLQPNDIICKFVSHDEVNAYMGLGDFAITPVKPIPTKRYCTPIKDGEYWALGLPVIITKNISDDSDIIERENIGAVLQDLTVQEYTLAIEKIDKLLQEGSSLGHRIVEVAQKYRSFEISDSVYQKIYKEDSFNLTA